VRDRHAKRLCWRQRVRRAVMWRVDAEKCVEKCVTEKKEIVVGREVCGRGCV
jgi:hypothetical protein